MQRENMWDENKVRIVDVAEELGLSTATVSNVLHGKTRKISDKTVKRVQDKLREMGYIPNMAATLLAQNNSRIIGVVVHDHLKYEGHLFEDPFVSGAINALSEELEKAGYFLMIKKTTNIMDAAKYASMWNMDGMILMGFCEDEYQQLRDRIRIPFVVYDGFFDNNGNICNLLIDNFDGGRQVGKYLQSGGHRNVLCIADNKLKPDYERYLGLCDGLQRQADFWEVPMRKNDRMRFYESRLFEVKQFTAVFAVSDFYAVDFMYHLIDHKIKIPEDISVIGFDDTLLASIVTPQLSTVSQDMNYRAKKAVEYLIRMKDDREYSMTEIVPVKLVIRESSRSNR